MHDIFFSKAITKTVVAFLFSDQTKVINFTPLQGLWVSPVFPRTP